MTRFKNTIVGYTYNNKTYCTGCIVKAMKQRGDIYRNYHVEDLTVTLDTLSDAKGIDRTAVWDYSNTEVPKEILEVDSDYSIDICAICDIIV